MYLLKKKKEYNCKWKNVSKLPEFIKLSTMFFLVFIDKPVQYEIQFWILQKIIDETIEKLLKKKKNARISKLRVFKVFVLFLFFFLFFQFSRLILM